MKCTLINKHEWLWGWANSKIRWYWMEVEKAKYETNNKLFACSVTTTVFSYISRVLLQEDWNILFLITRKYCYECRQRTVFENAIMLNYVIHRENVFCHTIHRRCPTPKFNSNYEIIWVVIYLRAMFNRPSKHSCFFFYSSYWSNPTYLLFFFLVFFWWQENIILGKNCTFSRSKTIDKHDIH